MLADGKHVLLRPSRLCLPLPDLRGVLVHEAGTRVSDLLGEEEGLILIVDQRLLQGLSEDLGWKLVLKEASQDLEDL